MSSQEHPHLQDFVHLRYLVVDEADRMIGQNSFPQLKNIFEFIDRRSKSMTAECSEAAPTTCDVNGATEFVDYDGGRPIEGDDHESSKVDVANIDLLHDMNNTKFTTEMEKFDGNGVLEKIENQSWIEIVPNTKDIKRDTDHNTGIKKRESKKRQTFIFSATLTLEAAKIRYKGRPSAKVKLMKSCTTMDRDVLNSGIREILNVVGASSVVKVVDLTLPRSVSEFSSVAACDKMSMKACSVGMTEVNGTERTVALPPGLSLYEIKCAQMRKDLYCYAFLTTTKQGSSGPCLIFCNSVAAVKRVNDTLRLLGLPVRSLHAQMPQVRG